MSTVTDASTPSRTRYVRGNPITAAAMISSLQSSHSGMYLCFSQCGGSDKGTFVFMLFTMLGVIKGKFVFMLFTMLGVIKGTGKGSALLQVFQLLL